MKKFVSLFAILAMLYSCGGGSRGELVGAQGKKWHPQKPYGMALIPGGSFIMGKSDDDKAALANAVIPRDPGIRQPDRLPSNATRRT
jgi:formylglycine-generating enzyme required for sulfatase activity